MSGMDRAPATTEGPAVARPPGGVDADHFHLLWYEELGMCACGTPETAYQLIRDILALVPFTEDGRWQQVETMCGGPGAAHVVVFMLSHAGLLEHGSTLVGSWLTPKGERVLELMRQVSFSEVEMLDGGFPHDGQPCPPSCWNEEAQP